MIYKRLICRDCFPLVSSAVIFMFPIINSLFFPLTFPHSLVPTSPNHFLLSFPILPSCPPLPPPFFLSVSHPLALPSFTVFPLSLPSSIPFLLPFFLLLSHHLKFPPLAPPPHPSFLPFLLPISVSTFSPSHSTIPHQFFFNTWGIGYYLDSPDINTTLRVKKKMSLTNYFCYFTFLQVVFMFQVILIVNSNYT